MVSILDIEASGLGPESYPIEIAAYNGVDLSYSVLLNPDTAEGWDHWDPIAEEEIHGISRDYLMDHGEDVFLTVIRMNKVLEGQVVYSDAVSSDSFWIRRLYEQVLGREMTFEIRSLYELFKPEYEEDVRDIIKTLQGDIAHRALEDCVSIYEALKLVPDPYWKNEENLVSEI